MHSSSPGNVQWAHRNSQVPINVEIHCDPICRDCDQDTPLHVAAIQGHIEVVKFLTVEMHCDTTCRNASTHTALHLLAMKGHLETLKFLISDRNCDPDISGQYGRTPHYAAECGHLHIVKYLIDEQHCTPSCLDENKNAPLHCAALKGHTDIVKFLALKNHCDPMSQNFNSNTAVQIAVLGCHLEVVMFFIEELKGPPDITGQWNMTPLQMALHENHPNIAEYLQDAQKQVNTNYKYLT